ncbi:hypothetical protein F503_04985 [Ophiostoma piceae UAMH 11346]|uniref:J domain-containing protein n=1 Tax=Ophiostoma piceae (strain UAMH 11346) TaxID=1262450 RepID=S3D8T7_OPHP1|nr:hypothetical protein F503_04985 [Ophiostoma piceae UAMH 11346]
MAKADYGRDYYADLELSSTADVTDIKKQFRKLALKYHPDRNPGKEAEVNAKFQTIQAAHEILTSPEQKQKYDSQRIRTASRYPTASGVRGNPWQDAGSQFPTPPRRAGQAPTSAARNTPASSSSTRPSASSSSTRFSSFNPPPTAKASKEDYESRYSAWQNMRPKHQAAPGQSASAAYAAANAGTKPSTGANTRRKASAATGGASAASSSQSMPPPPPPRTASQRQKADASFGTRRNPGFVPSSPMGDEPPAASTSNYFTQRPHPTRAYEQPEPPRTPAAAGRDSRESRDGRDSRSRNGSDESLFDGRQSTPYQTHGGEKFSLFDDVPVSDLHRAKSHRAANGQARPEPRRRSSSLPDESDNAAKATSSRKQERTSNGETAGAGFNTGSASTANTSAPRTGNRTRPGAGQRASYAPSSSTMPQFEEQYRKMQGEQMQEQEKQQHDPFTTPGAKPAHKNDPIKMTTEEAHAKKTRGQWSSVPLPQERVFSRYTDIYKTPPQLATGPVNSKRRASTSPVTSEPPSGGTDNTNASSTGRHPKTPRRSMNDFEVKQLKVLEGLVSSVGVYQLDWRGVASQFPSGESCKGQEPQHPKSQSYSGSSAPPLTAEERDINSGTKYSANLSLDDDVFSSPTTPVDQQKSNPFTSISVEDINTRFVSDDNAKSTWQFSAGGSEAEPSNDQHRIHRTQSGNRLGRRSPGKPHSIPRSDANQAPPAPPQPAPRPDSSTGRASDGSTDSATGSSVDGGGANARASFFNSGANNKQGNSRTTTTDYFDPQRWAEQIGSEHFIPGPLNQGPPVPPRQPTPNQQPPRPIKKPKPVSRTNTSSGNQPPHGPAYIVIEDDSDGSVVEVDDVGMASPVAMDIDSPPTGRPSSGDTKAGARSSINSSPTSNMGGGVRNIPVEPTRPEWRAGNVDKSPTTSAPMNPFAAASAVSAMAAAAAAAAAAESTNNNAASSQGKTDGSAPPAPPPTLGSEDSEEFRATLADIRKVEPFAENVSGIQGKAGMGLGSFGDLKSHLPFDSKAATPLTATTSAASGAGSTPTASRRKTISFPRPPLAPHPPPVLAVPGLQPSAGAWDKYVSTFRDYMVAWNAFNTLYVDHFVARRKDFVYGPRQPRAAADVPTPADWISEVDNGGIDQYLGWLEQDDQVRARWTQACGEHSNNVQQFKRYRDQMRQAQA